MRTLGCASLLLAASVMFALPAQAVPPKARVLTSAEVPASFGTPYSSEFSRKPRDNAKLVMLCTDSKGGPLASLPAPTTQYSSKIVMKPKKKVFASVNERVFVYPSPEAALAAYTQLAQEVVKCTGTMAGPADEDPSVVDTYASAVTTDREYPSFWVQDSTIFTSLDPLRAGRTVTYAVYSQAGDAVIQTDTYVDGRARVTAAQKSDLQQLAMTLSSKWDRQ